MKPILQMDMHKIKHNISEMVKCAKKQQITVTGITKGVCGNTAFASALVEAGVDYLADSRIENLMKMRSLAIDKMLLRSPKLSEVHDVVQYANYSLNSEIEVIRALSEAAVLVEKIHHIILMIDVGDLREGIWFENEEKIYRTIQAILQLKGVRLAGIGTNLTCFGGIIPTPKNYGMVAQLAQNIRQTFHIPLPIVSGGNSSCLHMLYEDTIPEGITNIRVNQSIFLGKEIAYGNEIRNWCTDVITLQAEIIELQIKPSLPQGEKACMNAFGDIPVLKDKGYRKRAILAIGRQDIDITGLKAIDNGITVEGASSDHLIVDVTDSARAYEVGDIIDFRLVTYQSILSGMASSYIDQVAINEAL